MSGSGRISVDSVVSLGTQSASQGCLIDVPLVLLPITGDGSELLYFPLVAPVAELLLHGQWSSVVGLGRWSALDLPADFRERIRPCGHEKAEQVELTPDRASFLADQVREWATTLLGQAADVDVDAMKLVSEGVNALRDGKRGFLVITHYQRLLDHIKPDVVHIMADGRIVKTGGPELALEGETNGYADILAEVA